MVKMTPSGGVSMKALEQHAAAASARGGLMPSAKGNPPHTPGKLKMTAHRISNASTGSTSSVGSMSSLSSVGSVDGDADKDSSASSTSTAPRAPVSPPPVPKVGGEVAAAAAAMAALRAAAGDSMELPTISLGPCNARVVEEGLASFFTHLHLNLQGIELTKPSLSLLLPKAASSAAAGAAAAASGPVPADQPLLMITMGLRLLDVPPIDMQF